MQSIVEVFAFNRGFKVDLARSLDLLLLEAQLKRGLFDHVWSEFESSADRLVLLSHDAYDFESRVLV